MPQQVLCPHCNKYKVISTEFRVHPKTGRRITLGFVHVLGKYILIPVMLLAVACACVIAFGAAEGSWDFVLGFFFVVLMTIFSIAQTIWTEKNFKKNPVGYDNICDSCGLQWTVNPEI
jgi:archaellum biogenesis protein FlaJ (TadC family)